MMVGEAVAVAVGQGERNSRVEARELEGGGDRTLSVLSAGGPAWASA